MSDPFLKSKNNETSQNDFEPLETDDKQEETLNKNKKYNLSKYILLILAILLIFFGIFFYKYYNNRYNQLNDSLLLEYNKLGKKDENLKLFPNTEFVLDKIDSKYIYINIILHFNKDDIDKNRLIESIKKTVRNQGILQSTFYKQNGEYHIKFDENLYPEINITNIKESDFKKYYYDLGNQLNFYLNELMYKVFIITTEKSLYCIFIFHHSIFDISSNNGIIYDLNRFYLGDNEFKNNDLFYASLYEFNLKLRNDKSFIKDVQDYYLKNYDLGRTFKSYHIDKDIKTPPEDLQNIMVYMSDKSLSDKVYNIFNGNLSRINFFNMMCQLYTLYLYNNMEDHIPEIVYVRHGRNLTLYNYTVGSFFQISIINYDFLKNAKKIEDKTYLNVQQFYDNVKKQFDEQKFISRYYNCFENYDFVHSIQNLSMGQLAFPEENMFIPEKMFGKKLLENTKGGTLFNKEKKSQYMTPFFIQNRYLPNGIANCILSYSDRYKEESSKIISDLFYKVVDSLSDGFLNKDKLIEIKKLN